MSTWLAVKERVEGRWQIPLLLASGVLLVCGVLAVRDTADVTPIEQVVENLETLVSGGLNQAAIGYGGRRLEDVGRSDEEVAPVHLWLARALYQESVRHGRQNAADAERIISHYLESLSHEQELPPNDYDWMGMAFEWRRDYHEAVRSFERAVDGGAKRSLDLRKHILTLRRDRLNESPDKLDDLLDAFLVEVGEDRLDLRLWAIERKLALLDRKGNMSEASTLLVRNKNLFSESDFRDRFAYLEALLMYESGLDDEAERYARTIRNRVHPKDEVYAMTGWLLGRIVLGRDEPQRPLEALSFFQDVIDGRPDSPYAVAAWVGKGEALGHLERHDEAIEAYGQVLKELDRLETNELVTREVLRSSLNVMAGLQRTDGHLAPAVEYAALARRLVDPGAVELKAVMVRQHGDLVVMLADKLDAQAEQVRATDAALADRLSQEARKRWRQAADLHLELAQMNTLSEHRASQASWQAAELLERAGQLTGAARRYEEFVRERPQDSLVPRALYRLGTIHKRLGALPEAVERFKDCARRFSNTLEGVRSLIPLAECYGAMGPEYLDLAEKTLGRVLDDPEVVTPQAPEFSNALFLLGNILNRRGSFEEAIGRLEEWLERFGVDDGSDPRVLRVRFLLADSYRQSGLALRRELLEAAFTSERRQMRTESLARLKRARALYRDLVGEFEGRATPDLEPIERLYVRHSHLYEADCLFEMQEYQTALKLYEEAAGMYQDTPSALAAYVQIINCHVFLEQRNEARAALARAEILVDQIPQSAFDDSVSPESQEDWKRYFEWLGGSELF